MAGGGGLNHCSQIGGEVVANIVLGGGGQFRFEILFGELNLHESRCKRQPRNHSCTLNEVQLAALSLFECDLCDLAMTQDNSFQNQQLQQTK